MANGIIIDWTKISTGGDVDILNTHYAFIEAIRQLEVGGSVVESLKLEDAGEIKVTEAGFREWLKVLMSVPWKEEELTASQLVAVNKIIDYLQYDYLEEQPMQEGGVSLEQME